jgi:hypothetical protein
MTWQRVRGDCYVAGSWGILEDAPGNWYLYPIPSTEVYGPFENPDIAQKFAEDVRGD